MQAVTIRRINEFHQKKYLYQLLVTSSWSQVTGYFVASFLAIHVCFACLYSLDMAGIQGEDQLNDLLRCLFLSVHTLSTIGYGNIMPHSTYIHCIVTLESFVSLFYIALLTGCFFVRLSRVPIHIIFSQNAVIYKKDDIQYLSWRLVNGLSSDLIDVQIVAYLRYKDFESNLYHLAPLNLMRDYTPSLSLNWVLLHPITQESPLYNLSIDKWKEKEIQLIVNLNGYDSIYQQQISQRHNYENTDIVYDHRFVDMLSVEEDLITVDVSKIHQLEKV